MSEVGLISGVQRGYMKRIHNDEKSPRGCVCPESLEHDGKCKNALESPKMAKCKPCAAGWHFEGSCPSFEPKGDGGPMYTTACANCGWDSGDHQLTETQRAVIWSRRS